MKNPKSGIRVYHLEERNEANAQYPHQRRKIFMGQQKNQVKILPDQLVDRGQEKQVLPDPVEHEQIIEALKAKTMQCQKQKQAISCLKAEVQSLRKQNQQHKKDIAWLTSEVKRLQRVTIIANQVVKKAKDNEQMRKSHKYSNIYTQDSNSRQLICKSKKSEQAYLQKPRSSFDKKIQSPTYEGAFNAENKWMAQKSPQILSPFMAMSKIATSANPEWKQKVPERQINGMSSQAEVKYTAKNSMKTSRAKLIRNSLHIQDSKQFQFQDLDLDNYEQGEADYF